MFNELVDTTQLMNSRDYRDRFVAEYWQTKIRYEKLKAFCDKIEIAKEHYAIHGLGMPEHNCSLELLRMQQKAMGEYLHILEMRAIIEEIDLT